MSFRELRDFTEILRTLGFPRQVSVDNFRQPNFRLVAEILHWLIQRYDPLAGVSDTIETEADRVEFVSAAVETVAARSGVKLRAKMLYEADGRSVRELLRLARVLYTAVRGEVRSGSGAGGGASVSGVGSTEDHSGALASRLADVSSMREASSELVESGARLHELLGQEASVREERAQALRFLDSLKEGSSADMERAIRQAVEAVAAEVGASERQCAELDADAQALEAKIAKRQAELERMTKRLESLRTVRPAFAGEYERLESELASEWAAYVTKHRNIEFLEAELSALERRDREAADAHRRALHKLQQKLREEELSAFRGDEYVDDAALARPADPVSSSSAASSARPQSRPGRTRDQPAAPAGSRVVAGRMHAPRDDDDDDDEDDGDDRARRRPGAGGGGDPVPRQRDDQDDDDEDLDDDLSDDGDDDGDDDDGQGQDDDDDDDDMF